MDLLNVGTHNPAAMQLIINGTRITGLTDDGVSFDSVSPTGDVTEGLDGGVTYAFNPSKARRVSVSVDPTKGGYRLLAQLRAEFVAALEAGGKMLEYPFIFIDAANGTETVSARTMFTNNPLANMKKAPEAVVFELVIDQPQEQHAALAL